MRNTGIASLLAAIVVVLVTIIFSATLVEPHSPEGGLGAWVYDYQSLIGGALAVAAAAFTIMQMRDSDDANDQRHRELYGLTIRADYLRVDRAFRGLRDWDELVSRWVWPTAEIERARSGGHTDKSVRAFLAQLTFLDAQLQKYSSRIFADEAVLSIQDLFDAHMVAARDRVNAAIGTFRRQCKDLELNELEYAFVYTHASDDHPVYGPLRQNARELFHSHAHLEVAFEKAVAAVMDLNERKRAMLAAYGKVLSAGRFEL